MTKTYCPHPQGPCLSPETCERERYREQQGELEREQRQPTRMFGFFRFGESMPANHCVPHTEAGEMTLPIERTRAVLK